jgi:hypothetical protein
MLRDGARMTKMKGTGQSTTKHHEQSVFSTCYDNSDRIRCSHLFPYKTKKEKKNESVGADIKNHIYDFSTYFLDFSTSAARRSRPTWK